MSAYILVALGGFFGAITRFSLSTMIKRIWPITFPLATFFINSIGSFLLGWIVGIHANLHMQWLVGTGFMGAFTTFSTFTLESIQLMQQRKWGVLLLYVGGSYSVGILCAFLGMALSSTFA
ncbi:camphor resistance protein CrcB [Fictibacillus macauensis ZFHKF-1]|uniref:Fluoride-specific ion channel FluC n=1 Tax=Fictibacillus macauensis ZFHKF-1 TaxID=1196324 RepID=I8AGH3_9BACL|nr:fluoride efflux transporter CrcB [Fictibacillus macauensis]EIT84782.1 camphor resistance protein CrcB [Fictibacillus macauensis ZFHKF-1]